MVLTNLQHRIVACLAANRSATSYLAGGSILNKDWPRQSDDIDIFHDTDEDFSPAAHGDRERLRASGFRVDVDIDIYGMVEATVRSGAEATLIQWTSESRRRFMPLLGDATWGVRLAPADLAANKVLAAATRRKARDVVHIALIGERLCPLGPLVLAVAGKPPHFSPKRMLDEIRRTSVSMWDDEFATVKGLPNEWTPTVIRERILVLLSQAEAYVASVPPKFVGCLAVDPAGVPIEIADEAMEGFELRAPTEDTQISPQFPDHAPWS